MGESFGAFPRMKDVDCYFMMGCNMHSSGIGQGGSVIFIVDVVHSVLLCVAYPVCIAHNAPSEAVGVVSCTVVM